MSMGIYKRSILVRKKYKEKLLLQLASLLEISLQKVYTAKY